MTERCDVAIVGYGPTGQVLAILLAQRGWRVTVLERWPTAYPMPRAVHFDHEVGRIFQAAGVSAEVRAISEPCTTYEWRNAAGERLVEFRMNPVDGPAGWSESQLLHHPDLERVLDRRARSFRGVSVRRGFEVFEIEPAGQRVHVRARDASGALRDVEARYAIGCDGANSFVRRWMRAPIEDLNQSFDWLIVDVIARSSRRWENWQLCDPARPTTIISGGPGRRRFEFLRLPHETIESLNDSRMAWELLAPWGLYESNTILERHTVYRFRARWAETWRSGHVLLAGDAAHQMPPFTSQGIGAGVRDAATLAWKLDLVLLGRAPPRARAARVLCVARRNQRARGARRAARRSRRALPALLRARGRTHRARAPRLPHLRHREGPGRRQRLDRRARAPAHVTLARGLADGVTRRRRSSRAARVTRERTARRTPRRG